MRFFKTKSDAFAAARESGIAHFWVCSSPWGWYISESDNTFERVVCVVGKRKSHVRINEA